MIAKLNTNVTGAKIYCMIMVGDCQIWAGMKDGSVVVWNLANREDATLLAMISLKGARVESNKPGQLIDEFSVTTWTLDKICNI